MTSREWLPWSGSIFLFALAIRGLELFELSLHPIFSLRMGDGRVYHLWAQQIAQGSWIGDQVFYQAPLYPYTLAVIYRTLGESMAAVRLVQIVLGALGCALLVPAGWRLFSKRVGILSGFALALYAPAMFADVTIQKSVLDVFFVCSILALIAHMDAHPRGWPVAALGLVTGALILTRENALVFVPILLAWIAWLPGSAARLRVAWAALFVTGVSLVLVPVAVRNWSLSGDFHLTTSQFGHNFFIGNNPNADGTYRPLLYGRGDPLVEREDAIRLVERAIGRRPSYSEASSFYTERALRYIRDDPVDWMRLMGRKAVLAINRVELVDTQDQYTHAEYAWTLWLTGSVFHFGVLAPLAFIGAWLGGRDLRRLWPLYAMAAVYAGTLLLFYVFARYRLPIVPILVLFAARGVLGLPELLETRSRREIFACLGGAVALAIASNWPLVDSSEMRSVSHYNIGNELAAQDDIEGALSHYRVAIELHTDNAMANHNIGVLFARRGELDRARSHLHEALRISPRYAEAFFNLARTLADSGDPESAITHYGKGLEIEPERPEIWVELGLQQQRIGDRSGARLSFERALRIAPDHPEARRALSSFPREPSGRPDRPSGG